MKKSFLAALVLFSCAFTAFSADVTPEVLNAFKHQFSKSEQVEWKTNHQFVRAKFTVDGELTFAYYKPEGDLIAVTKTLKQMQLPATLAAKLNKKLDKAMLANLFQVTANDETKYYAVISDGNTATIFEGGANNWRTFKKEKLAKLTF